MSVKTAQAADPPPDWAAERAALVARIAQLEQQLAWFQRQLFGEKSERRREPPPEQLSFGEAFAEVPPPAPVPPPVAVPVPRRAPAPAVAEEGPLCFDERVPVQVIPLPNPETEGLSEADYEIIGEKVSYRLAQRPGSYVVLKYVRPVIKRRADASLHSPPAPASVVDGGRADVSFLAGLVVDKFRYHLPLYRQHQRLLAAGIQVSRQWLTQQVLAVAWLLAPLVEAQR